MHEVGERERIEGRRKLIEEVDWSPSLGGLEFNWITGVNSELL